MHEHILVGDWIIRLCYELWVELAGEANKLGSTNYVDELGEEIDIYVC